jgi:cytochrome oxidase Cu insertion factor (SCO1/SenC/PrrC family)
MQPSRIGTLAVLLPALALSSGCPPSPNDELSTVADFTLRDQEGRQVARADLLGKVWVASFVFTRCTTMCPQVCATLAELQQSIEPKSDVKLVSFTVDPDHDTPEVLKKFATRFGADSARWLFLTGPQDKVYDLISRSFLLGVQQNEGTARMPGNEVTHSSRLVLVDRRGCIHEHDYFDGRKVDDQGKAIDELPRLRVRLAELIREKP